MKSKAEIVTVKIKKIVRINQFIFINLYYIKRKGYGGKKKSLARQNNDDSNPHEIIPISFNMHKVYYIYYKIDIYLVQTRSQARSRRIRLPEVHDMGKNLDPNIKLEKTTYQSH